MAKTRRLSSFESLPLRQNIDLYLLLCYYIARVQWGTRRDQGAGMNDRRNSAAKFDELMKLANGSMPVSGPMAAFAKDVKLAVASILRKGEMGAVFDVKVKGKRVIVILTGVAHEARYATSSLVAREIEALKRSRFREERYRIHHTVFVDELPLVHSH